MKSVSEVGRILGVTRKTLRGYKDMGLLMPTVNEHNGYWYYDDYAVMKLLLIQIFVEAGYKRKKIKKILESSEFDFIKELENVLKDLEEKQTRIKSTISLVNIMKDSTKGSNPLRSFNIDTLFREKSFKDAWESVIKFLSQLTDSRRQDFEMFQLVGNALYDIGSLKGESIHSKTVREHVIKFNSLCIGFVMRLDESAREKYNKSSSEGKSLIVATTGTYIAELFCSDQGMVKTMEMLYGPGDELFIMEAVMNFGEYLCDEILNIEIPFREIFEKYKRYIRKLRSQNDGKDIRE